MRLSFRALELKEATENVRCQSTPSRILHRKHKRRIRQEPRTRRRATSCLLPSPARTTSLLVCLAVMLASAPWNPGTSTAAASVKTEDENFELRGGVRQFSEFVKLLSQSLYSNRFVASYQMNNLQDSDDGKQKPLKMPTTNEGLPIMLARRRTLLENSVHQHYSHLIYNGLMAPAEPLNQPPDGAARHQQQHDPSSLFPPFLTSLDAYLYQTPVDAYWKTHPYRRKSQLGVSSTANQLAGMPPYPPSMKDARKQQLRDMFYHAYNSYMTHAFPAAELKPLTCQPGTFELVRLPALTLIDTLDTLLLLGDSLEFAKSVERLKQLHAKHTGGLFHVNQNVSVFETNIRVLGGLLSAHQLAVAYLPTPEDQKTRKSPSFPPVVLADVFRISNGEESQYLQMPDAVRSRLEQHGKQQIEELVYNDVTETCLVNDRPPQSAIEEQEEDHKAAANDWWEHCGAGVLALEDCAVTATMKTLNQTAAKLYRSTKIIRDQNADAERQTSPAPPLEWEYDGFLLELALDMGKRLLPAFDTQTGIPYGTVNLKYGVPEGETTIASLAGGGTLTLEMELLSRLTGDGRYGKAAKLATRALWTRRSPIHLVGKHIDVHRGFWTETISGIGSNSDSFLEYLLKHYLLFPEDHDFWTMLQSSYEGTFQDTRLGEWYADVEMKHGLGGAAKDDTDPKRHRGMVRQVLESLMAFYPGMQLLLGEQVQASRSLNSFFMVREYLGFLPERFNFASWRVDGSASSGAARNPLRPELLESCYFMHRATMEETTTNPARNATEVVTSSSWLWAADFALTHLDRVARVKCGYGSVRGLSPTMGSVNAHQTPEHARLFNEMPSFFLSETVKYLFLTFDDDNILHTDPDRDWIFTTEAHPIHHVSSVEEQEVRLQSSRSESAQLVSVKDKLRTKLQHLIQQRTSKANRLMRRSFAPHLSSDSSQLTSTYLTGEKWSENTRHRSYKQDINTVTQEVQERTDDNLLKNSQYKYDNSVKLGNFFGNDRDLLQASPMQSADQFFVEVNNLAHTNLNDLGLGGGFALKKACPNLQASDLLWMRALNGGVLDYTDAYVSAVSDSDDEYPPQSSDEFIPVLTAVEAVSLHGSGVYLDSDLSAVRFPLVAGRSDTVQSGGDVSSKNLTNSSHSTDAASSDSDPDRATTGVQQLQLDDLGLFEVSAFPEGSGFYMHHVATGDSVTATFISDFPDEDNQTEPYVMTYGVMPSRKECGSDQDGRQEDGETSNRGEPDEGVNDLDSEETLMSKKKKRKKLRWKDFASFFQKSTNGDRDSLSHENCQPKRSVVLADFSGNSFSCQVRLIKRPISVLTETMSEAGAEGDMVIHDTVIASYPCAPALFGPTHFSSLLESDGIFLERTFHPPPSDDEYGCDFDIPSEASLKAEEPPPAAVDEELRVSSEDVDHNDDDASCENKGIHLVQRGLCNFQSKAVNLKRRHAAEAVIVINSEDEELFVMSHGDDNADNNEIPPTVLVTGLDGEEILRHLELQNLEANGNGTQPDWYLLAQLSLQRPEVLSNDGTQYPIVQGSADSLQVLAQGGWGIHAVRSEGSFKDGSGSNELQLFMLRHNSGT